MGDFLTLVPLRDPTNTSPTPSRHATSPTPSSTSAATSPALSVKSSAVVGSSQLEYHRVDSWPPRRHVAKSPLEVACRPHPHPPRETHIRHIHVHVLVLMRPVSASLRPRVLNLPCDFVPLLCPGPLVKRFQACRTLCGVVLTLPTRRRVLRQQLVHPHNTHNACGSQNRAISLLFALMVTPGSRWTYTNF